MERVEKSSSRSFAPLLFLTGVGTGVAVTLLFSPLSGAATRRLIGRKVKEGEMRMKHMATAVEDCIVTRRAELGDRVKQAAEVIGGS